jgi:hypothetical protein
MGIGMIYSGGTMVRWSIQAIMALMAGAALAQEPALEVYRTTDETARVGRPVEIVYDVAWQGEPQSLHVLPLQIEEVEWGSVALVKSEAYQSEQLNHVAQTVEIIPGNTGEFHVPKVLIPLRYPEATFPTEQGTDESGSPHPGAYPTLRADPLPITVRAARSPAWISGGLGASFFVLGLVYYWMRRRTTMAQAPLTPEQRHGQARQMMHRARRHRLDGDFRAYYIELGQTASLFNETTLKVRFDKMADLAGYAGTRPTDDDLDAAWRDIERAAAKQHEHP